MHGDTNIIDNQLDDWNGVDRKQLGKDINDFFHKIGVCDDRIDAVAWTGLNDTDWHMPLLVEMFILGLFGGLSGMTLSFIIIKYLGG